MSSKHSRNIEQRSLSDSNHKDVLPFPLNKVRYINSEWQAIVEMRSDCFSIHENFGASTDRFEMDNHSLVIPVLRNLKRTAQPSHSRFLPFGGITGKGFS